MLRDEMPLTINLLLFVPYLKIIAGTLLRQFEASKFHRKFLLFLLPSVVEK